MNLDERGRQMQARYAKATGVTIRYIHRGCDGPQTFDIENVTVGNSNYHDAEVGQVRLQSNDRDYLIPVSILDVIPQERDYVLQQINGRVSRFIVAKRDQDPCFSYSDRARTLLRVHTVEQVTWDGNDPYLPTGW